MIEALSDTINLENPPQPGEWTFADYLHLSTGTETRYEVIAGVLYKMPTPSTLHQHLVMRLILRLGRLIEENARGILYPSPIEVILPEIATPVQPDLVFVGQDRLVIIKEKRIEGAPDLVIEILSPSSVRHDRVTKFEAYESSGVLEYWILNPKTQTLEIYTLEENLYTLLNEYGPDESIHSPLLGELAFTAGSLFD